MACVGAIGDLPQRDKIAPSLGAWETAEGLLSESSALPDAYPGGEGASLEAAGASSLSHIVPCVRSPPHQMQPKLTSVRVAFSNG